MRVLGLDYGEKRIGLAVSDTAGALAFPAGTLHRKSIEQELGALGQVLEEREIERIVVGLPLLLDGTRGSQARAAQAFVARIEAAFGLPVETIDERFTSVEAERSLRESGRRGRKQREVIDSVAATLLLRSWLERHARRGDRCD